MDWCTCIRWNAARWKWVYYLPPDTRAISSFRYNHYYHSQNKRWHNFFSSKYKFNIDTFLCLYGGTRMLKDIKKNHVWYLMHSVLFTSIQLIWRARLKRSVSIYVIQCASISWKLSIKRKLMDSPEINDQSYIRRKINYMSSYAFVQYKFQLN
jgi:hypothetical protein